MPLQDTKLVPPVLGMDKKKERAHDSADKHFSYSFQNLLLSPSVPLEYEMPRDLQGTVWKKIVRSKPVVTERNGQSIHSQAIKR